MAHIGKEVDGNWGGRRKKRIQAKELLEDFQVVSGILYPPSECTHTHAHFVRSHTQLLLLN